MMKDCIDYSKGCEGCQRRGPIQQAPSVPINPVVKPWSFRGWAMDLIGKIYPASSPDGKIGKKWHFGAF
ncbi:unnamed protein product [Prunus armeniaca]